MSNAKPTQAMFMEDEQQPTKRRTKSTPALASTEVQPVKSEDITLSSNKHNLVRLPSNGLLGYPAEVEYRDIMVRDEEVLAGATPQTYAKTLNSVLKGVLNDCDFYEKLAIHDRDYLLIWVWANNYSQTKKIEFECPHCEAKEVKVVDLTKLPTTDINDNLVIPYRLDIGDDKYVTIHPLTVEDELFVEDYITRKKIPNQKYEFLMTCRSINVGIDMPFDIKVKWIENHITGKQMSKVRQFHTFIKFGVDSKIDHTCSACGGTAKGDIPFQTTDILFPSVSGDNGDFVRNDEDFETRTK